MTISRRALLKNAVAVGAMIPAGQQAAFAQQASKLNVLAVPTHADMLRGGPGGNIAAEWEKANNAAIQWLTFSNADLAERLFRELSLRSSTLDVSFFFDPWASPTIFNLLEPLDSYMASSPIDDFDDIFPGLVKEFRHDGKLYGIPVRQNIAGLHYNEVFFEERGITRPPETMEELLDYARKLTYTRKDGTPVAGLALPHRQSNYTHFVRGWNADYIADDYTVKADAPEMIAAITALQTLYKAGALPRQFTALSDEDNINWMQTGRAAMTVTTMARYASHNDPKQSQFPGKIKISTVPILSSLKSKFPVAPVGLNYYSVVIPRNSQNKQLAWNFVRSISAKSMALRLAQNGNSPVRRSLYEGGEYAKIVPYAAFEGQALEVARVALPPFTNAPRAADAIAEESDAATIGLKTPEDAMGSLAARLKRLLPK